MHPSPSPTQRRLRASMLRFGLWALLALFIAWPAVGPGCAPGPLPPDGSAEQLPEAGPDTPPEKPASDKKSACETSAQCSFDPSKPTCKEGQCVPCQEAKDCPQGQVCDKGECRTGSCLQNADCTDPRTPICEAYHCASCKTHAECGRDKICDKGRCFDGGCLLNADCQGAKICKQYRCSACQSDAECSAGELCDKGQCRAGCRDDYGCKSTQRCDPQSLQCKGCVGVKDCPFGQVCKSGTCDSCSDDAQCGEVGILCENGRCTKGLCRAREHCKHNQACVNRACVTCTRSSECGAGAVCDKGKCYAGDCATNGDCRDGKVCLKHRCSACTQSSECGAGKVCSSGKCFTGNCATHADCKDAARAACRSYQCAACTSHPECGAGRICVAGICIAGECLVSSDCAHRKACQNKKCITCAKHAECGAGYVCDASGGAGQCFKGNCVNDGDCTTPPRTRCKSHVCAACGAHSDCKAGEVCDQGLCQVGECATRADCKKASAPACISRKCEPCKGHSDCGAGEVCDQGQCFAGDCVKDSECLDPKKSICSSRTCSPCTSHAECKGLLCIAGQCGTCTKDADCSQIPQKGRCLRARCVAPIPPDPATLAPKLKTPEDGAFDKAMAFLYSGPNPLQVGVKTGAFQAKRLSVLRGKLLDSAGKGLPSVEVSVLHHPDYGATLTRADGSFDIAVNGGTQLTLEFKKSGYMTAQRSIQVPWQRHLSLDADVILLPYDSKVTTIGFAAPIEVAQGSKSTDADGTRTATMLFQQGTKVTLKLPDGTTKAVSSLKVRATEYTVGPNGKQRMPAALPKNSAYTYAVELSADEAVAAGATSIEFDKPVFFYVENFLQFPVGGAVPTGYYDRTKGKWIPSENGRVLKILSISGGVASLDVDGSGKAADAAALGKLGVSAAELKQLASLYSAGQSVWRVPVTHFTPFDCNWPYGPPPGARPPQEPQQPPDAPMDQPDTQCGSVIRCQNQSLGESLSLTGVPFKLHYNSARAPDRSSGRTLEIPVTGATLPPGLKAARIQVEVAGQIAKKDFPAQINQSFRYTWDGKDAFGRVLHEAREATISIAYQYQALYKPAAGVFSSFMQAGLGKPGVNIGKSRSGNYVDIIRTFTRMLKPNPPLKDIGGWTLGVHHSYDPRFKQLSLGTGQTRTAKALGSAVVHVAGGGKTRPFDYPHLWPMKSITPLLGDIGGLAYNASGELFFTDKTHFRIYKVTPDGQIDLHSGRNSQGRHREGSTRKNSLGALTGLALDPLGQLFFGSSDRSGLRIERLHDDKLYTHIGDTYGYSGDKALINQKLPGRPIALALDGDGNLYFSTHVPQGGSGVYYHNIHKLMPDGSVALVAGAGPGFGGDGDLATKARFDDIKDLAVDAAGNLYVADYLNHRIRKISTEGIATTVAGDGSSTPSGDGGPATQAGVPRPVGVAADAVGNLYIASHGQIRLVTPAGVISTIAGTTDPKAAAGSYGVPALKAHLGILGPVTVSPTGEVVFAAQTYFVTSVGNGHMVLKLSHPGTTFGGTLQIPSQDGAKLFIFNLSGRHLSTKDTKTGSTLYSFGYDPGGRLVSVTDQYKQKTTLHRDAQGALTAISGPFGARTTATLDANGWLASLANPKGETTQMTYTKGGLLTQFRDPNGHASSFTYDAQGRLAKDQNAEGGSSTISLKAVANQTTHTLTSAEKRSRSYQLTVVKQGNQALQSLSLLRENVLASGLKEKIDALPDGTTKRTRPDGTTIEVKRGSDPRWGMRAPLVLERKISTPGGKTHTRNLVRIVSLSDPDDPMTLLKQTDTTTINGRVHVIEYDATTRTKTKTSPMGRKSIAKYDAQHRLLEATPPGLATLKGAYNSLGQMTSLKAGAGASERSWQLSYGAHGRISQLTNPLNQTTALLYDKANRISQITLANTQKIGLAYDKNGKVTSLTPPGKTAHTFGFNKIGLLTRYTAPQVGATATTTTFAYNKDRQRTLVTRPGGSTLAYAYDAAGRLQQLTLARGSYRYDYGTTHGHLTKITSPDGSLSFGYDGFLLTSRAWAGAVSGTVSVKHNDDFHITEIAINGGNTIAYTYDKDLFITKAGAATYTRDAAHGLLKTSTLGAVSTSHSYNAFGELASTSTRYNSTALYSASYVRDKLGRITQKSETLGGQTTTWDYSYDKIGQLTGVKKDSASYATYVYDANGNRSSTTLSGSTQAATHDAQDRLTALGNTTYTYTAAGELASKTEGSQKTTYTYDALGHLTQVLLPGGKRIEYVIGATRRIGKKVNGVLTQGLLYRAGPYPVAELDGSNKVVSVFVYGSRKYVPDYMVKAGKSYWLVVDHIGSVRLVVDAATAPVAQRLDYDPFGRVTQDTNPGFQPFGFAGGLYDHDTGLTRFGHRDYDPAAGRWTAKDPILFESGQTNLYAYVQNNPINLIDPSGLFSINFSAYMGYGFGFELHWTPGEGFAVCAEVGFGVGGGASVGLSRRLPNDGASVGASISAGAGTVGITAGAGLHTHCGLQKSAELDISSLHVDLDNGDTTLDLGTPDLDLGFQSSAKLSAKGCTRF